MKKCKPLRWNGDWEGICVGAHRHPSTCRESMLRASRQSDRKIVNTQTSVSKSLLRSGCQHLPKTVILQRFLTPVSLQTYKVEYVRGAMVWTPLWQSFSSHLSGCSHHRHIGWVMLCFPPDRQSGEKWPSTTASSSVNVPTGIDTRTTEAPPPLHYGLKTTWSIMLTWCWAISKGVWRWSVRTMLSVNTPQHAKFRSHQKVTTHNSLICTTRMENVS